LISGEDLLACATKLTTARLNCVLVDDGIIHNMTTFELPAIAVALLGISVAVHFVRKRRADNRIQSLRIAELEETVGSLTSQLEDARLRNDRLQVIDPLTELANRRGLEVVLEREVNRAQRNGSQIVAVVLNCDDFKRINETLGHAVGDVALKEMVERITTTLRPSDYVARIGGDEFVILLTDTQYAEAKLIAERVRLAVAESPIRNSNDNIFMTASLAVAVLPYEISSVEDLLAMTRHAVKESKTLGKNRVTEGTVAATRNGQGTQPEASDIVEVLRNGDCFRCAKHPIMRLEDEVQVGYELLVRGPAGPFQMPYDFFRIAMENNLLTRVDLKCMKTCIQAAEYLERGSRFDVNLFPSTIIDTPIDKLVDMFPLDKGLGTFCVEISEQQFIGDPSYLKEHVAALKTAGVHVAIDDVGFGRSSLESLILLEPDIVKVDIKYVAGIALDLQKQRLLRRLIGVVEALGAELIAEGVETREDMEVVQSMGVKYAQGYLWGYPTEVKTPNSVISLETKTT
jgi:diguanylate cyclase (GGDEF)-like protein